MHDFATAEDIEAQYPGLLDQLEAVGVSISNNAGAIIVEGYLGRILGAIEVTG